MAFKATIAQQRLGKELRRLRGAAGLSITDAEAELGWPGNSKLSKIERYVISVKRDDLTRLVNLYQVPPDDAAKLYVLLEGSRNDEWWRQYSDVLTVAYTELIAAENEALRVRLAQPTFVPGILQTREYAHAIIADSPRRPDPDRVDALLEVRMRRQQRLEEDQPPAVDAVIAETVLHNQYGPPGTLHRQLCRLRDAAQAPNIALRVVPFDAMVVMFQVELYEQPDIGDVVFSETHWSNIAYETEREVRQAQRMFDHFAQAALSEAETLSIITKRIRDTA
jgi:transcriptional regulator with XRE-family HTH domain